MEEESVIHKFLPVLTRWVLFGVAVFFALSGFMPREEQNKIRPVVSSIVCEPSIFPSKPVRSYSDTKESTLHQIILRAASRHKVDPALVKAVIRAESGYNPMAVSKKGARGLMQIMPQNYQALNIKDPFDPHQNIMGGTRYFRTLYDRYDGKLALTLSAYNAGPTVVDRYQRIPPIPETERYVEKVMRFYRHYKNST